MKKILVSLRVRKIYSFFYICPKLFIDLLKIMAIISNCSWRYTTVSYPSCSQFEGVWRISRALPFRGMIMILPFLFLLLQIVFKLTTPLLHQMLVVLSLNLQLIIMLINMLIIILSRFIPLYQQCYCFGCVIIFLFLENIFETFLRFAFDIFRYIYL